MLKIKIIIIVSNKFFKLVLGFLTANAKEAFCQFQRTFTKALVFQHFDTKQYIWIETNASRYAISGILNQLAADNLGQ